MNLLFVVDVLTTVILKKLDDVSEREYILAKAKECVCGHREEDYGSPEDNFTTIAKLWSAYKDVDISAKDVAMMMALLKIARAKSEHATEDCFVDLAGYAACGGEIVAKEKEKTDNGWKRWDSSLGPIISPDIENVIKRKKELDKTENENNG